VRKSQITPEIDRLLDNEAYRRFRGDHISERTRTKSLAAMTGLSCAYVANIISLKRREYERKVNVSCGTSSSVKDES
jgi:hypothetical protein